MVLPDWFDALNRDICYQLTPLGEPTNVAVVPEAGGSRFTIRADKPGVEVCWQVTGVRQDRWAEAHPISVEEDKPAEDRGYFLHPEAHDEDDDNPGIEAYMGQMEATFAYRIGTQTIAAVVKNNLRSNNKGGIQLDYSFPLFGHFKGYVQAYSGYGENLIDGVVG